MMKLKEIENKNIIYGIILGTLFIALVFIIIANNPKTLGASDNIHESMISVDYKNKEKIIFSGREVTKEFTVENIGNKEAFYTIKLNISRNDYKADEIFYTLKCIECNYEFSDYLNKSDLTMNIYLESNEKHNYIFKLYYNEEKSKNLSIEKLLKANFKIEGSAYIE